MSDVRPNYGLTKAACYSAYFTMSSVFSLPPLLFVTFRRLYGISYTLLGTLVLINFCTQLTVDLIFTFRAKRFDEGKMLKIMPLLTAFGLAVYALVPNLFPAAAYGGLVAGTVIFSVAAGLSEVLLSPTIAALPSDNPGRDMSLLHSLYAFGVFAVVTVGTLFLRLFGADNWMWLTLFLALWPLIPAFLFAAAPMPERSGAEGSQPSEKSRKRRIGLILCAFCIFFGSCSENAMSNWVSGFMEQALKIDKTLGDILGMAGFAVLLGLVRIGYARFGKNIARVLGVGMAGAALCYLVAGLSADVRVAFAACVLTGCFTSMLWPGTLILMEERIPGAGVAAFALMAAGGDLGASVSPQLLGIVADRVSESAFAAQWAGTAGLTAEQIGLKAGMLTAALFPILGVGMLLATLRYLKNAKFSAEEAAGA